MAKALSFPGLFFFLICVYVLPRIHHSANWDVKEVQSWLMQSCVLMQRRAGVSGGGIKGGACNTSGGKRAW